MTRSLYLLLLALLTPATLVHAQEPFPDLVGEGLDGRSVQLPAAGTGSFTLIGMAHGQKAAPVLEEWYEPAYLRFVAGHGLFAKAYKVEVYFVPMFVGLNKAAYEPTMKKVRQGAAPEVADRIIFFKGDIAPYQEALGMPRKDIPYFFVLDAEGRIVHSTEGRFTDEKLEAIEAIFLR